MREVKGELTFFSIRDIFILTVGILTSPGLRGDFFSPSLVVV